jgi:hypothetical protein
MPPFTAEALKRATGRPVQALPNTLIVKLRVSRRLTHGIRTSFTRLAASSFSSSPARSSQPFNLAPSPSFVNPSASPIFSTSFGAFRPATHSSYFT